MPEDPVSDRFQKRQKQRKLDDLSRRAQSIDDLKAEEELLKKTKKVEPIKAGPKPDRNAPCPCGSGRKYKKCCGRGA
ncbi:MAG TPA: SEC-C metal-binding domain-containing protein [Phycisphaerae bacterium]|nr:SEC-C metal-binding domain-containing protein [Phycisphaerae bacterium]